MTTADRIGIVQGLKTACLGMGIMLILTLTLSIVNGNSEKLLNAVSSIDNIIVTIYIIIVMCICGITTGRIAGNKIIYQNKKHLRTGILSSTLSLILFGFLSSFSYPVHSLLNGQPFDSGFFGFMFPYTLLVTIVGLIPAIIVGSYLGISINNRKIRLQL
ncbi:MAG: hypothetical protein ACPGLV_03630 [Bacteroidia bacterium]